MELPVFQAIRDLLEREGVAYQELSHAPTFTSAESARARGEDLRIGGKALLIKVGDVFRLFVLCANLRVDSPALKAHFHAKRVRFASATELRERTGLVPGAIPPFGRPILPFDLFVDPSILENERIAFNAGSLNKSMILAVKDYIRVAKPTLFHFAAL